jgi:hypothetical protein
VSRKFQQNFVQYESDTSLFQNHLLACRAISDPSNWDLNIIFHEFDIVLSVLRQILIVLDLTDILSPAGQLLVDGFATTKVIDTARHLAIKHLAVKFVVGADLQLFDTC